MRSWRVPTTLAIAVGASIALLAPIGSYDFFWHLATGRWITEHGALPLIDPFGVASEKIAWINGEWIFQVLAWSLWSAGAVPLTIIVRSLLAATGVAVVMSHSTRSVAPSTAAAFTALAVYGAEHRLTFRPEGLATLFAVIAFALAFSSMRAGRRTIVFFVLTVVWMNVHPSALLAPLIFGAGFVNRWAKGERQRPDIVFLAAPVAALLLNPWGLRGVVAPFHLAAQASGRAFVNTEWLPTSPSVFPVVYLAIALVAVVIVRRLDFAKKHPGEVILFVFFSFLAIRYVRNHGFFFAILPMLAAPFLPEIDKRLRPGMVAIAILLLAFVAISPPLPALEIDGEKLPVRTTRVLVESRLGGNIYNPDQFGGYLIHSLYPSRRVLTDGRNELYLPFIREVTDARGDSRKWNALLAKHDVRLALEDYRGEPLRVVNPISGETTLVAPSLAYFPRQLWALIGFDDAAMLFARRDSVDPRVLSEKEFTMLVPDDTESLRRLHGEEKQRARQEAVRASREMGGSEVLARIYAALE